MHATFSAPSTDVTPIRVLVVEQQALFGKALCQVLAGDPDLEVVGDVADTSTGDLERAKPDLIVLDLDGHPSGATHAVRECRGRAPEAKICVLSTHLLADVMQLCLGAGADGFIVKDILPAELIRAVKTVAAGHPYVDPRVAGGLLKRRGASIGRTGQSDLSLRETEIIRLIARGLPNKEISARLGLSEKTVKNHISRIFAKLNITARTQAAVHAIRTGIV